MSTSKEKYVVIRTSECTPKMLEALRSENKDPMVIDCSVCGEGAYADPRAALTEELSPGSYEFICNVCDKSSPVDLIRDHIRKITKDMFEAFLRMDAVMGATPESTYTKIVFLMINGVEVDVPTGHEEGMALAMLTMLERSVEARNAEQN